MVGLFPDFPIRAFPQSVYMHNNDRIKLTKDAFVKHKNLQLGARDQVSYDWLNKTFGASPENNGVATGVTATLTPDIVFMYGNRPEYRNEPKQ
jgi:exopolysaccharide biosynthesis predicted pyruvyltransferase EpsI